MIAWSHGRMRDMTYDGHVKTAGPSEKRTLNLLSIWKISVSGMDNNAYLLACARTGAQLLIDAADESQRLLELVDEGSGRLDAVVTTHQHWDHHRALPEVARETGAETYAGVDDAVGLPVAPDHLLRQGDEVRFGDVVLEVSHLRGHTPGSVALAYRDPQGSTHLFTGDTLFPGGVGNTKMEGQSFELLYGDVVERLFGVYDDDTHFYPGHGADSTIGAERPHLDEWRERGW